MGNQVAVSNNQIKHSNRPSKKTKHLRPHRRTRTTKSNVDGLRKAVRRLKTQRQELDRKLLAIESRSDEDARLRRLSLMSKLHRVSLKLESAEHRFNMLVRHTEQA